MKAVLCIDDAVGETRRALLDLDDNAFRLDVERWSERGKRAGLDEIWWGRVKARMPGNRGWFVDLGLERDGLIDPSRAVSIVEGALLALRIKAEAWADKGPTLSLADMPASTLKPTQSRKHASPPDDPFLRNVEIVETRTGLDARRAIEAAIDEAQSRVVTLPGGGDIAIERARALTVVDVDGGNRKGEADPAAFALGLNMAAADETARQLSLRGVGGLVAMDFVGMDGRRDQRAVVDRFRQVLAERLGRASEVLEMSSLGVCEAAIARRQRPLRDALHVDAPEREALDALREMETAGVTARAARIHARLSAPAVALLDGGVIEWKSALADRIGARWTIEAENRPLGKPVVWSA